MFEDQPMRRTVENLVSVFDLIRVVGGQKNPHEVWKRLAKDFPDVLTDCENIKFSGRGQKETPCVGKKGALKILGLLPGEAGDKYRDEAAALVLAWCEAPDELAKGAIARIDDREKLADVLSEAQQKYLSKYHPLFDEVAERVKDGYAEGGFALVGEKTKQASININTLNTCTILGKRPKEVVAERGGKNARSKLTVQEYNKYSMLQDAQLIALGKRPDIARVSQVNEVCRTTAQKFTAFLESI